MMKIRAQFNSLLNTICWLCVAKMGLALGVVSIFVARRNITVPVLAIIFSIVAMIFNNRQVDSSKRDMTKVLSSIGLTLGLLFLIVGFFRI